VASDSTPRISRVSASAAGHAHEDACQGEAHARTHDQSADLALARAERLRNADLTNALRDAVGEDAVESKRGEEECRARARAGESNQYASDLRLEYRRTLTDSQYHVRIQPRRA
jgi:hypothetical protein